MSDEDNTSDEQGFLRQRRNLIVGTLILLFLETTVSPPDKVNILGVTLEITRREYIIYWLWLFTFYWLIRFFQYLPRLNTIKIHAQNEFRASLKKLLKPIADRELNKFEEAKIREDRIYYVRESDIFIPEAIKFGRILFNWSSVSQKDKASGKDISRFTAETHDDIAVGRLRSIYFNVVSGLDVCVRTPIFTEYVVPILLFIAAAISSIHRIL